MKTRTIVLTAVVVAIVLVTTGYIVAGTRSPATIGPVVMTTYRSLASGTVLQLQSAVRISSAQNRAGDPVTALVVAAALTARGDTVIPVGAVVNGTIARIAESGGPNDAGTLELRFTTVTIHAVNHPVALVVTRMATHLNRAGVTTEDAAKVAAAAAAGAVAGRIIGEDRAGARIGAAAGAAAGAVYANRTRDRDVVLAQGAAITASLTASFRRGFSSVQ